MQNRRNPDGLADFGQPRSAIFPGRFRGQQSGLAAGHGRASGGENDDIVLNQFLDHGQVGAVMGCPRIVAAYHSRDPADPSMDDVVVERPVRGPEETP